MDVKEAVVEILREEYGIKSMKELNEAISRLGSIDLFPFCGSLSKEEVVADD